MTPQPGSTILECVNGAPPKYPARVHTYQHQVFSVKDGVVTTTQGRRIHSWVLVRP